MAGGRRPRRDLFTASEVARFCQVDLKTIHNWAERGKIPHFRTPGRHLRFRRADVIEFLRRYDYPMPASIGGQAPRVALLLDESDAGLAVARRALAKGFETSEHPEPLRALLALGADPPDAVVVGGRVGNIEGARLVEALASADATRGVVAVLCGSTRRKAGRAVVVPSGDGASLRAALETLLSPR